MVTGSDCRLALRRRFLPTRLALLVASTMNTLACAALPPAIDAHQQVLTSERVPVQAVGLLRVESDGRVAEAPVRGSLAKLEVIDVDTCRLAAKVRDDVAWTDVHAREILERPACCEYDLPSAAEREAPVALRVGRARPAVAGRRHTRSSLGVDRHERMEPFDRIATRDTASTWPPHVPPLGSAVTTAARTSARSAADTRRFQRFTIVAASFRRRSERTSIVFA